MSLKGDQNLVKQSGLINVFQFLTRNTTFIFMNKLENLRETFSWLQKNNKKIVSGLKNGPTDLFVNLLF